MCTLGFPHNMIKIFRSYRQSSLITYCRYLHMLKREAVICQKHRSLRPSKLSNFGPTYETNRQFEVTHIRHKSSKKKSRQILSDSDTDTDDDDEVDAAENLDNELFSNENVDGPAGFRYMKIHSQRALNVIAKGLGESTNAMQKKFYQSKVLHEGKVLLKKSRKVTEGSVLDLITEDNPNCRMVKRVEIVKVSDEQTRKGNPIVYVRVWRKPFEVDAT